MTLTHRLTGVILPMSHAPTSAQNSRRHHRTIHFLFEGRIVQRRHPTTTGTSCENVAAHAHMRSADT
jgi:hypothetical protein